MIDATILVQATDPAEADDLAARISETVPRADRVVRVLTAYDVLVETTARRESDLTRVVRALQTTDGVSRTLTLTHAYTEETDE